MSLRTSAGDPAGQQETDAAPGAPLCGAEPGPAAWRDCGGQFPEYLVIQFFPCADPAAYFAQFECPCGHAGTTRLCAPHAEGDPDAQNCRHCAEEYGHRCLVTLTLTPL